MYPNSFNLSILNTISILSLLIIGVYGKHLSLFINLLIYSLFLGLPFHVVDNPHFINLINYVSAKDVMFTIPKRRTISNTTLEMANDFQQQIKTKVESINNISLTLDGWTSKFQKIGYLGITAHYMEHFEMKSLCLCVQKIVGSHTGEHLSNEIYKVLSSYGIVNFITTDNAANMVNCVKDLKDRKEMKVERIPCMAHLLNLIVKKALASLCFITGKSLPEDDFNYDIEFDFDTALNGAAVTENRDFIKKLRKLVGLFSHSLELNRQLIEDQLNNYLNAKPRRLIQDVPTR